MADGRKKLVLNRHNQPNLFQGHRRRGEVMGITRRVATVGILAGFACSPVSAQGRRQINLIVPFPPGGSVDTLFRVRGSGSNDLRARIVSQRVTRPNGRGERRVTVVLMDDRTGRFPGRADDAIVVDRDVRHPDMVKGVDMFTVDALPDAVDQPAMNDEIMNCLIGDRRRGRLRQQRQHIPHFDQVAQGM